MESVELVYRNATVHYPTAVLVANDAMLEGVLPGVRHRDNYVDLAREWFARGTTPDAPRTALTAGYAPANTPAFWVDHKANVTTVSVANTVRRIGFFFKPVTGADLISYTAGDATYPSTSKPRASSRNRGVACATA